jgi:hypothetical protein
MLEAIRQTVWKLRLDVHPSKSRIYRTADGFGYLGLEGVPGPIPAGQGQHSKIPKTNERS